MQKLITRYKQKAAGYRSVAKRHIDKGNNELGVLTYQKAALCDEIVEDLQALQAEMEKENDENQTT